VNLASFHSSINRRTIPDHAHGANVRNIHVSDQVISPSTRRGVGRGHGKM
jgi:hypothetical protein